MLPAYSSVLKNKIQWNLSVPRSYRDNRPIIFPIRTLAPFPFIPLYFEIQCHMSPDFLREYMDCKSKKKNSSLSNSHLLPQATK
ncbi:hypothetical protein DAPPUDRAFT_247939 [Daphnia pulex]|uniref:Uncharacterized protein n=1 Tax=Daphnia pulex TaxID=6669 RepID=E9GT58_DAPPU|nr:hypothetical protein DAPPUDRAFT_247939 [Daphnia pulex]|eukprot:EFX77310.1 hypothetical protein DAPPUDRAFT_247939 [Daphnia pulex]